MAELITDRLILLPQKAFKDFSCGGGAACGGDAKRRTERAVKKRPIGLI
jgi:hypothetical protein